mmetsp:Transcript_22754/g.37680  ORF Transcript_22754/g.37680 Transcript_22754/m.37680 type:complete len:414 (-) Transcript_22754:53-1294(-)
MDRTLQSLQDAIQANHEAQEAVRKEIEVISRTKKRNRRNVVALQAQLPATAMMMFEDGASISTSDRPWTKRFFVDQKGSIPPPNEDTKLRLTLEKDKQFIHQSPFWSKKEISYLHEQVVVVVANKDNNSTADEDAVVVDDFQLVATAVNEKFKTTRSADECRVKYQPNRAPFTKQESLDVLKQHHKNNGEATLSLPNRTNWQAFQAFHGGAGSSDKKVPWTVQQDQVLFKTIAAAGPQHVVDQGFAHTLSAVLEKSPKTILQRTTTSLLNPNFVNHQWSETDERRLCLLMKVYRDSQFPFVAAASHFPNRGSRSVHDKWSRTLDPNYDLDKQFTPEEDHKLRQLHASSDWKGAEKQFPGRLSQSLTKRWKELVSEEKVVEDYSRTLKRKQFNEFDHDDVVVRRRVKKPPSSSS